MDATRAFNFARGTLWHLEAAMPHMKAALTTTGSVGDDFIRSAAHHLDEAARDLASAAAHGAPRDAMLGAALTATAGTLRNEPPRAGQLLGRVDEALTQAQRGVDELVHTLDAPTELLSLQPAMQVPISERALVHTAEQARLFRETSPRQRETMRHILATGDIDPEPIRLVGGYGNGNGQMAIVRVRHPHSPHLSVVAVQRPPTAQAAQEEFFAKLTEHARIDDYFAPVVRREDGSALVLAVPGGQLWDDLHSGEDIAKLMRHSYRLEFPNLPEDEVRRAAQVDYDMVKSMDYLTAQADRNGGSPMGDAATGMLHFIDNGFTGRGEMANPLKPTLKAHFMGEQPGRASVHPDAARHMTTRLDDAALADAHAILGRGPNGVLKPGQDVHLAQDAAEGYLQNLRARRDQLGTGSFEYWPMDLNADPLKHSDWLRSTGV